MLHNRTVIKAINEKTDSENLNSIYDPRLLKLNCVLTLVK